MALQHVDQFSPRSNHFVKTYDDISSDNTLTSSAKNFFTFLQRQQFKGQIDFTHAQIAKRFGVCTRTVRNWVRALCDKGLLRIERKKTYCLYHIRDAIDHTSRRRELIRREDRNPDSAPRAYEGLDVLDVGSKTTKTSTAVIEGDSRQIDVSLQRVNDSTDTTPGKPKSRYSHLSDCTTREYDQLTSARADRDPGSYKSRLSKARQALKLDSIGEDGADVRDELRRIEAELAQPEDTEAGIGFIKSLPNCDEYEMEDVMGTDNYEAYAHSLWKEIPFLGATNDDDEYNERFRIAVDMGSPIVTNYRLVDGAVQRRPS